MIMFMTWILSALLIVTSQTGLSDADLIYGKVGGSIDLNPGQISETIKSATWKHNADLAVEWFGQEIICYRTFEGRCDFNKTSGSVTINNLTLEDRGSYTPEINNKVLEKKELQVIKPVPKPTVSIKCNEEKTSCSLTCEAQVSAGFGPVTYKWKTGDTELSTDKEPLITTENKESSFFCELVNPVSSSSSETVENPLIAGNHAVAVAVPLVIILLLVVAAIVAAVLYQKGLLPRLRELLNRRKKKSGDDVEGGTKMNSSRSNGKLNKDETESAAETEKDGVPVTECDPLLNFTNTADVDQKPTSETRDGNLDEISIPDSYESCPETPVDQKQDSEPKDGKLNQRSSTPEIYKSFSDLVAEDKTEETKEKPGSSDAAGSAATENKGETNNSGSNGKLNEDETESASSTQEEVVPLLTETNKLTDQDQNSALEPFRENQGEPEQNCRPEDRPQISGESEKPGSSDTAGSIDIENKEEDVPLLTVTNKVTAPEEKTEETKEKPGSSETADSAATENKDVGKKLEETKKEPGSSEPAGYTDEEKNEAAEEKTGETDKKPGSTDTADSAATENKEAAEEKTVEPKEEPGSSQTKGSADKEKNQETNDSGSNGKNKDVTESAPSPDKEGDPLLTVTTKVAASEEKTGSSDAADSVKMKNKEDEDHQQASGPADNNQVQIPASATLIQPNSNESDGDHQQASGPADNNQNHKTASPISFHANDNKSDGDHQQSTDSVDKWKGQTTIPPFSYQQKDNSSPKQSGEKTPDPVSEDEKQS